MAKRYIARKDKIALLKKIRAGKEITKDEYSRFQGDDFTNGDFWLEYDENNKIFWKNLSTGEVVSDAEHIERTRGHEVITFE